MYKWDEDNTKSKWHGMDLQLWGQVYASKMAPGVPKVPNRAQKGNWYWTTEKAEVRFQHSSGTQSVENFQSMRTAGQQRRRHRPQDCSLYREDTSSDLNNLGHCFAESFKNSLGGFSIKYISLLYIFSVFSKCGISGTHPPTSLHLTFNSALVQIDFQRVKSYIEELQKTSSIMVWIVLSFHLPRQPFLQRTVFRSMHHF